MSGHVVPAVTDHGLGGSGHLLFSAFGFPRSSSLQPCGSRRPPAGGLHQCPGPRPGMLLAPIPAPGCSLHPSSPRVLALRVWPQSRSKPRFSHSKPFSHPAQVGDASFSLFFKGMEVLLLTGDATCFVCWMVSAKPRAKAASQGGGHVG